MAGIFISYRRADASGHAGRLHDAVRARFPEQPTFMDVELAPGSDFVAAIERSLSTCDVFIAVIGERWSDARDGAGRRRLEDPDDVVRLELQAALARPDVTVIPVLVDDAKLPGPEALPGPLAALARRQATRLRHDRWRSDMRELLEQLARLGRSASRPRAPRPRVEAAVGELADRVLQPLAAGPGPTQRTACMVALARAEERFVTRHEEMHSALLDERVLHDTAPALAEAVECEPSSARRLATAWAAHFGSVGDPRLLDEIEAAIADLLALWREELRRADVFGRPNDGAAELVQALGALDRAIVRARCPALEADIDWRSRRATHRLRKLAGREWLFEQLQEATSGVGAAYVSLVAEAGLGKTAFALAVAERFAAPVFLFSEAGGGHADRCLAHLCSELIDFHGLTHDRLPDRAGEDPGFLVELLEQAVRDGPVWIVIDALDEARALPLPDELPTGAFVLLTHRPGDFTPAVAPGAGTALRELRIRPADERQRDDLAAYLRGRSEDADLRPVLDRLDVDTDGFAERVAEAADGNFVYATYVIDGLLDGSTRELSSLPRGLTRYYEGFWKAISGAADGDWETWTALQQPVIELLAVAAEPVTPEWLADVTGCSPAEIQRRALRAWRRFLVEEEGAWRIVHQSFREFLSRTGDVDLPGAQATVAKHFLGRWTDHDGYALRHLTSHLRRAGEREPLFALVHRDDWRAAHIAYDPSGSTYERDLGEAWEEATAANQDALAAGRPPQLLHELRLAIATAEQQSRVANAPAELLVRLVETGRWSDRHALAAAASPADPVKRTEGLTLLAANVEGAARRRATVAAAAAANAVTDHAARARAFTALLPLVDGVEHVRLQRLRAQAVAAALEGAGPRDLASQIAALAESLTEEERPAAIRAADAIADPRARLWGLLALGAADEQLGAAARDLRAIDSEWERHQAIEDVAGRAPAAVLGDLLDVTLELADPLRRWALNKLAPRLGSDLATRALSAAATIDDPGDRFVTRALLGAGLDEPAFWSWASAVHDTAYEFWGLQMQRERLRPASELPPLIRLIDDLDEPLSAAEPSSQAGVFLAALAPRLQERHVRDAFALAREHPDEALEALAPLLPEELVRPAFDAAVETILSARTDAPEPLVVQTPGAGAARALAALARHRPDPLPDEAILADPIPAARLSERQSAVAIEWTSDVAWETRSLSDEPLGPRLVARLAPHLPEPLLPAALDALAVRSTQALSESIGSLGEHERPEAARLAVAAAVGDPFVTAAAAPYLVEAERDAALRFALAATKQMDPASRSSALVALIPHLSGRNRRKAIKLLDPAQLSTDLWHAQMARVLGVAGVQHTIESALPSLSDADVKRLVRAHADARLGAALAPRLSARQALALLLALDDDEEDTSAAFSALVPRLDEGSLAALRERLRPAVLLTSVAQALAPPARGPWLTAALAATQRIADPGERAEVLLQLVPDLTGVERDAAIEAAHEATTQIARWAQLVSCARTLAELLPGDEGEWLAATALDQVPADFHVVSVAHLAPVLGARRDAAVAGAFAEATANDDPVERAMLLVELAPVLPERLAEDAVAAASAIPDPDARLGAIAAFAARLEDELLAQLLRASPGPLMYAHGIAELVAHLGPSSAPAALELTSRILDPGKRAQAVSALADAPSIATSALHVQLGATLRAAARLGEPDFLYKLLPLLPAMARVGGGRDSAGL